MGHPTLLVQLLVILVVSRAVSWALRWLGQPPVIGEMITGLLLGPIVFGAMAPTWQGALFAPSSLGGLNSLSTIGLVLFMFIVGAELRFPSGARRQMRDASYVGGFSVLLPAVLGLCIAPMLYAGYAPKGIDFWPFAMFIAVSVAITALPVMARILKDRHLTQSEPGQLAIAAAAVTDVFAWVALALVVALISAHGNWAPFWRTCIGLAVVVAAGLGVLRPLLVRWLAHRAPDGRPANTLLAILLAGAIAFAAVTDWLGLHAVFGAFLFGLCLPRDDRLLHSLIERIEHVAVLVLLPIFFVLSGLNTTPNMLTGGAGLAMAAVLAVAIVGKVLGGLAGARLAGRSWRTSLAVGSLMNARGLMELIVIKVGLDIGAIDQRMYTILLIMAILTTVMTTPMVLAFTQRVGANETANKVTPDSRPHQ
ncbi:cation:proton antiporter [Dyella koreensis]|uniref:Cation:proton antiporter n=1 Tax=Dyella koreensis TaxID=311235 RepID=A0ABW8K934_9GAMM